MSPPHRTLGKHDLGMLVVSLFWGANFTANKYAVGVMPPMVFAAIRFTLSSLLLALIVWRWNPGSKIPARTMWQLAGLGVIGNTAYQVLFMLGLLTTSAINASLIMAALPVVVAVLGRVFGIERTTPRIWLGIIIGTAGVATVIAAKGVAFSEETILGDFLVLAAVVCWALFTVGVRAVGAGHHPARVTTVTVMGGTPGLLLAALPAWGGFRFASLGWGGWLAIVYASVCAIVIAYLLWSWAVQGIGGSRTALYNCVVPLVAAVVAWAVLGEHLVPAQLAGAALVIIGVLVSQGVTFGLGSRTVPVPDP